MFTKQTCLVVSHAVYTFTEVLHVHNDVKSKNMQSPEYQQHITFKLHLLLEFTSCALFSALFK